MMDKNAANTHVLVVQVEPVSVVKKTHRHAENDTNTS